MYKRCDYTRFSNEQAKLLKSQNFAPELEHLVNMTKVNMEVIKSWITRRVTELLGFEDDVKLVNGKEVQIQITGFMEKNTEKFMKELWTLLLSAQKNASGVPQLFFDAKEEEIRMKKDGGFDVKNTDTASDPPTLKPIQRATFRMRKKLTGGMVLGQGLHSGCERNMKVFG